MVHRWRVDEVTYRFFLEVTPWRGLCVSAVSWPIGFLFRGLWITLFASSGSTIYSTLECVGKAILSIRYGSRGAAVVDIPHSSTKIAEVPSAGLPRHDNWISQTP